MSPPERCESSVGLAWWKCNLKSWWKNWKKKMPLCEVTQRHPTQTISVKTWKSPECKQGFSCKSSDMPLRDIASDWTPLFSVELTSTLGWTHKHIKKSRYKLTQDRFGIQWNKRCMNRTKCFAHRLKKICTEGRQFILIRADVVCQYVFTRKWWLYKCVFCWNTRPMSEYAEMQLPRFKSCCQRLTFNACFAKPVM